MNVMIAKTLIAQQITLPNGSALSDMQLSQLISDSVRQYSRWRALKRRFGEGGLAVDALAGVQSIITVGNNFSPGDTIILDAYSAWAETATVETIERIPPALTPILVGTPVQLNLVATLANTHYAGGIVAEQNLGLNIVAGQQQYSMPSDFMKIESGSWDLATGARRAIKQFETFYDGVYQYSTMIQGVDAGMAQNFMGGSNPSIYWGVNGTTAYISIPGIPASYSWDEGQNVILNVVPTPMGSVTLDPVYYWALHQPETVPDSDMDAIVSLASYLGIMSNAAVRASALSGKEKDASRDPHLNAKALTDLAASYLANFTDSIRNRPKAMSG